MSVLPVGIGSAEAGEFQIERSLRFNSADSAYLNRTFTTPTNAKAWTFSTWIKRSKTGAAQSIFISTLGGAGVPQASSYFTSSDTIQIYDYTGSAYTFDLTTTQVFRDLSAWYHLVFVYDSANATSSSRVRLYVNGTQITSFNSASYPTQNADCSAFNRAYTHYLSQANAQYLDGYLTEVNFIDGSALDPTSFGEYNSDTGVWQPKAYTGSYGTNGFYLNFSDNSGTTSTTLGKDSSGNGNNWTPNNFSVTAGAGNDSLVDTPTPYGTDTGAGGEVRGNYATLNSAFGVVNGASNAPTNGNLDIATIGTTQNFSVSTIPVSSGKWYFEGNFTGDSCTIGIWQIPLVYGTLFYQNKNFRYFNSDGKIYNESGATATTYNTYTTGDVIGVALDMDNGKVYFSKNGTWQGSANPATETNPTTTGLTGTWAFAVQAGSTSGSSWNTNFGQRPFAYTAPSGFKALCTQNLPEPTIVDGGQYFNTVLYTGNGSTQSITGVGFQPDWVWDKSRSNADSHMLFDSVRGVGNYLRTNLTSAEVADASTLTSFDSDGVTVGDINGNTSGSSSVLWAWKAGGSGVSNTDGTITSTVSANTDSGFSIVTYTGTGANATVGHGLGVAPSMVIVKKRSGTGAWVIGATFTGFTWSSDYFQFDTGAKRTDGAGTVFTTAPTSSVISVGSDGGVNGSGSTHVAYCFAPVSGYSAFSSYTGNGSTDGPFVYTGFRPAFVMIKRTDSTGEWLMFDSSRSTYNQAKDTLLANSSGAEFSYSGGPDILSNGFKNRGSSGNTDINASGGTFVYMAFSEVGFKYALGR